MKTSKRSIYFRVFGGLLALWLVFLGGFSLWQCISQRDKDMRQVSQRLGTIERGLEELVEEYDGKQSMGVSVIPVDMEAERNARITSYLSGMRGDMELEMAYFNDELELMGQSGNYFPVSYWLEGKHGVGKVGNGYAVIDLNEFMPEEEARKLYNYASHVPDNFFNLRQGDISYYHIILSLWTDGKTCIPKNIYVFPQIVLRGEDWIAAAPINELSDAEVSINEEGVVEIRIFGGDGDGGSTVISDNGQYRTVKVMGGNYPQLNDAGEYEEGQAYQPVWSYSYTPEPEEIQGFYETGAWFYSQTGIVAPEERRELQAHVRDSQWLEKAWKAIYAPEIDQEEAQKWTLPEDGSYRYMHNTGNLVKTSYEAISPLHSVNHVSVGIYPYHFLVSEGAVYPLRESLGTIGTAAGGSLILFLLVGGILCWQLGKVYDRQRELEAQRRRTTNAIAHDLKTPMAAISGYAENLLENTRPEKQTHYIRAIHRQVGRMNEIVLKMLELSRLEAGVDVWNPEKLSLKALCQQAIEPYSDSGRMFLIVGDAEVKGDRDMLLRVFDNLLSNAVRYALPEKVIEIRMDSRRCQVLTPGAEIPADSLPKIWEAYYQTDESRSAGGSGLGLAITGEILRRHGFAYGAENSPAGTLFWFSYRE